MVGMIGIHGKMGSGKDTLLERLRLRSAKFQRHSFADPLKRSAAVLLGMTDEQLDKWKRDGSYRVRVTHDGYTVKDLTIRTYLQRYGTEAHRDIFGDNFWVDQAMRVADQSPEDAIPVFTDVRFENEALAIIARGGRIIQVSGPDEDTGEHASEKPLPIDLVDYMLGNSKRDDDFEALDAQVDWLIENWGMA